MGPIEQLTKEHKTIKRMLAALGGMCAALEGGKAVPAEDFEKAVEFIRVFADKRHHGKEEDLLFPALEELGMPREQGPIGVMLHEHGMGRDFVRGLAEAAARLKAGDMTAAEAVVENARGYAALLDQHIDKEDGILYPMAEAHLSGAKMAELAGKFEAVERRVGREAEFLALVDRLEKAYLETAAR